MATFVVSSGQTSSGLTINNGDTLTVQSGGTANATTVNSGSDTVFGTVSGTLLEAGTETISSGGLATSSIVALSGQQLVRSGAITTGTQISGGGFQDIASSGSAIGTVVSFGGSATVENGARAIGMTVAASRTSSPAPRPAPPSWSNGELNLFSGAIASLTTVVSSGVVIVSSGGSATSTTDGGLMILSAGGAATSTLVSGSFGNEQVYAGATETGAVVSNGGLLQVGVSGFGAGGTVTSATVKSGGLLFVDSGGVAIGAVVSDGGQEDVFANGSAISTVISSGGQELVFSGATVSGATILSGGLMQVSSGAIVTGPINISAGGLLEYMSGVNIIVSSGQTSSGIALGSGASLTVLVGRLGDRHDRLLRRLRHRSRPAATPPAPGFPAASSSSPPAAPPPARRSELRQPGRVRRRRGERHDAVDRPALPTGGLAVSATVSSGGALQVFSGGQASGAVVNVVGVINVFSGGSATNTVVSSAGNSHRLSAAAALPTSRAFTYGNMTVSSGGSATGHRPVGRRPACGRRHRVGRRDRLTGFDNISSGAIASGTTLGVFTAQNVQSSGSAVSTLRQQPGRQSRLRRRPRHRDAGFLGRLRDRLVRRRHDRQRGLERRHRAAS